MNQVEHAASGFERTSRRNEASGRRPTGRRLDGAALDRMTLLLLTGGALGGLLFTAVYLVEGATRPGYDALVLPISALSLGPGGWVQQANFVGSAWSRSSAPPSAGVVH